MKKYLYKTLIALICSMTLVSCSTKPEVVTSSSTGSISENKEPTDTVSSSSNLASSNEENLDNNIPLELSEQLYNGDEVLTIITSYNQIIKNFNEALEKIETNEITLDNLYNYFSKNHTLKDGIIYLNNSEVFKLGSKNKFIPNGIEFSALIEKKVGILLFFFKDNLNGEAYDYYNIEFKYDNSTSNWIVSEVFGPNR